ncbi:acyl-CoA Delta(11) desaturase-like [Amyelois transitella]|uniref:Delta 11 desaturase n=1 Tax=Amyelois transitella TaxID=680683 RepID=S4WAY4_AMYTR|nr:acyl-CoA Delta(11) desaturase-like [Amyelois transitella]AGO96562.1 delta 11 desaturase [Amyelois transitella]
MVPNKGSSDVLSEHSEPQFTKLIAPQAGPRKYKIVYRNLLTFGYWHLSAVYGLYLCFTCAKWATILFAFFLYVIAEIGITGGAHRLWAHRTYKAKLPLEILLLIMNSIAFQDTAFTWARDHRLHHKYSDTDADPHNATRGFFYSHVGWLLVKKHPEVKARGKYLSLDDLKNNPLLKFQKKYAILVIGTLCFLMPTFVPVYFWGEGISTAWNINLLRYVMNLNMTFLVNSAAHIFGNKPYDKSIASVQNISVSLATFGEGFHNYHHTYPWDYRAAELGNNRLNMTTAFIDFFAWIGWAYDLKSVPQEAIAKRCAKTGDGTDMWGRKR